MRKHDTNGFTLIELLAVIVILGVLSAAAVPMYRGFRDDARRAEARHAIAAIVTAQHKHWQASGQYTNNLTFLGEHSGMDVELIHNWTFEVTSAAGGYNKGFFVKMTAKNWVNRQGDSLYVILTYNLRNAKKTWEDDTGLEED